MFKFRPAFFVRPGDSAGSRVSHRCRSARRPFRGILLFLGLLPLATPAVAGLSLAEAEQIAVDRDAVLGQLSQTSFAMRERAVASSQIEDPSLRIGAVNVPVDSLDLSAENMTMLQVGVRQAFPAGGTRELRREQMEYRASAADAAAIDRRLQVQREVRRLWTELAFVARAGDLLDAEKDWVEQLRRSALARYASGEGSQLEVLQAGLGEAMLREQRMDIDRDRARQRAQLARWLGEADAERAGPFALPPDPGLESLAVLEKRLLDHPAQVDMERRIEAANVAADLAKQRKRPGWMLDFSYGFRSGLDGTGESRSDLVSAVVSVDLPLFAANRQDREVAAARADARSLHDMHMDHQRELNGELVEAWQVAKQTSELEAFYASELLPLADQSVQAALLGWRNDRAGIDEVVKARRVALETRLKHLRLAADRALAHFDIDYLAGEQP
jgi:outer membrane protein TolC